MSSFDLLIGAEVVLAIRDIRMPHGQNVVPQFPFAMGVATYVKALVIAAAAVSALGAAIDSEWADVQLDDDLQALLLAEENNFTSYVAVGRRNPPNWTLTFIKKHGYPTEVHKVKTRDGYFLTLNRIPGNKDGSKTKGPPVLMHHGFMGASGDFVALGPSRSLAFILADLGFDVWIANARGSTDSREHESLNPRQMAFWDFSWHDIGERDIPAEIDYILQKTNRPSLSYIGFSMGTTAFFVMGSEKPEYMQKVNKMIALGPVAFMRHVRGPLLKHIAPLTANAHIFAKLIGASGEFAPSTTFVKWAARKFCGDSPKAQAICSNVLFMLFGFTDDYVDTGLLELISEFAPAGASIKTLTHFAQLIKYAPTFRKYDYGRLKNPIHYKQKTPPGYNLKRVTCPTYLFVSENDWFATVNDVNTLRRQLPNVRTHKIISRPTFTHFDFIYAKDADELLYSQVVDALVNK